MNIYLRVFVQMHLSKSVYSYYAVINNRNAGKNECITSSFRRFIGGVFKNTDKFN